MEWKSRVEEKAKQKKRRNISGGGGGGDVSWEGCFSVGDSVGFGGCYGEVYFVGWNNAWEELKKPSSNNPNQKMITMAKFKKGKRKKETT